MQAKWQKHLIIGCAALFALTTQAAGKPTFGEFQDQARGHIKRVAFLAEKLFNEFGGECKTTVPIVVARGFFKLHDYNKLRAQNLYRRIYDHWGEALETMDSDTANAFKADIQGLNHRDNAVNFSYLAQNGLADSMTKMVFKCGRMLTRFTEIADHVDRAMAPQAEKEWGNGEPRVSESYMLMHTPEEKIARFIEVTYYVDFPEQWYLFLSQQHEAPSEKGETCLTVFIPDHMRPNSNAVHVR